MGGQLPAPKTFLDWIPLITAAKSSWSYSDYAASWLNGAHMLLKSGTTTVADIEAMPDLLPEVWDATPLRVFSFLEMTGIRAKRDPAEIHAQNGVAGARAQPDGAFAARALFDATGIAAAGGAAGPETRVAGLHPCGGKRAGV
jgi:hypothetical protein